MQPDNKQTRWVGFSLCEAFCLSFTDWQQSLINARPRTPETRCLVDNIVAASESAELQQDYEALFYGTRWNVQVPLWASAACGQPVLLNETTLAVIHFYHLWGHTPPELDGNPADFIGNQFHFLGYLDAARRYHQQQQDGRAREISRAIEDFTQQFLLDTLTAMAASARAAHLHPAIIDFITLMEMFVLSGSDIDIDFPAAVLPPEHPLLPAIENSPRKMIHTAGVNNCGGRCVINAYEQQGCILEIGTDCGRRTPQLRACVRGRGYRHTFLNTQRLRYPMKRVGRRGEGRFSRISWDEAIGLIASEWRRITDKYGPASRYPQASSGNEGVLRGDSMMQRLMNLDGGHLGRYNNYSSACVHYIMPYVYGDNRGSSAIEDVLNTQYLLLWGHNPAETLFGTERNYALTQLKQRGVRIVVIDPRQSDTALAYANEWIGIRPSTDSALADGMAYVIWTEGLYDKAFIDKFCVGMDEEHMPANIPPHESYVSYLLGHKDGVAKTPEWAAAICGVDRETIKRLAREYATAKPACLMPGLGIQRTGNGEQTVRSLALLACLTGNVGVAGGGAAGGLETGRHPEINFPKGENPYPGKIPCFLWSRAVEHGEEMTSARDGITGVDRLTTGIKMLVNIGGNLLVNQHADVNDSLRILNDESRCEFILCADIFMTSSARCADILLPAPSFLEMDNFSHSWLYGDYILSNNKVRAPLFESRPEWDWIHELAGLLGHGEKFAEGKPTMEAWRRFLYEQLRSQNRELPEWAEFIEEGGYRFPPVTPYVAYQEQRQHPDKSPFNTPSGKIEIFSNRIYALGDPHSRPAIPKYVACHEGAEDPLRQTYPLQLLGWHTKRRAHSVHDNNPLLEEVEPQRLWINPQDAAVRNINDGDTVLIFNARGTIRVPAHVTTRVIKGVVGLPQGAWYTPDTQGVDIRGCINTLTSTAHPTPFAKGNPQHTNLVEVRADR